MIGPYIRRKRSSPDTSIRSKRAYQTNRSRLKSQTTLQSFNKTDIDVFIVMQGALAKKPLSSVANVVISYVLSKKETVFINIISKSTHLFSSNFSLLFRTYTIFPVIFHNDKRILTWLILGQAGTKCVHDRNHARVVHAIDLTMHDKSCTLFQF